MRVLCNGSAYDTEMAKPVAGDDNEWTEAGWLLFQTPRGSYFKVGYGHEGEERGPFVLLLNKNDLQEQWAIDSTELDNLREAGWSVRSTSAQTGEGVEDAFRELAVRVAAPK
jgi:hypothetical protein